ASTQRSTTWEPMNPAPPVTRIFTARIMRACLPAAKRLVEPALGPSRVRAKVGAMTAPGGTAAGREPAGLGRLFAPRAIALIGVPGDLSRPGARPLHFLQRHGCTRRVYPVNPGHRTIGNLPAYPSVDAVPEPTDVAWIGLPAAHAADALAACGRARVPV